MHTDNRRVDHLHGRVMGSSQRVHDPAPDARPPPANEAIVAGGIGTEAVRQIAPRCPGSQYPKDAVEDTAVVHPWDTARLVRQHRLDGRPLMVGEFVAHDFEAPSFGSLQSQACGIAMAMSATSLTTRLQFHLFTRPCKGRSGERSPGSCRVRWRYQPPTSCGGRAAKVLLRYLQDARTHLVGIRRLRTG